MKDIVLEDIEDYPEITDEEFINFLFTITSQIDINDLYFVDS